MWLILPFSFLFVAVSGQDFVFIFQSVVKTGRLLVAHEAPHTMGFAAEIAATVQVATFPYLIF